MKLAVDINLFENANLKGLLGSGEFEDPTAPNTLLDKVLSGLIGIITIVAFVWFLILVVTGALGIMFSAGDKNAVATNAKKITNGLIGIVVIILAIVLIRIIAMILGFADVPFLNPGTFIENFTLK